MSDFLPDTPALARYYCPGCDHDADPTREILDPRWCNEHEPGRTGSADDRVTTTGAHLSGSADVGGEENKRWCDLLHRPS